MSDPEHVELFQRMTAAEIGLAEHAVHFEYIKDKLDTMAGLHQELLKRPSMSPEQLAVVEAFVEKQNRRSNLYRKAEVKAAEAAGGIVGKLVPYVVVATMAVGIMWVTMGTERFVDNLLSIVKFFGGKI